MILDPLFLMLALPGFLFAMIASFYVKSTFAKYSRVASKSGLSGAQAAHSMLSQAGINDVRIEQVNGFLSDHYDPTSRTLRLSPDVYNNSSLSAIGVACHEAGHALQHADAYLWLTMRSSLVPLTNIGSMLSYPIFFIGFLMHSFALIKIGVILFSLVVFFSLITLPVEWNASARAKVAMVKGGIVTSSEAEDAGSVLNAAFMTYVASAVSALLTLLYYLMRSGLLGGRRD